MGIKFANNAKAKLTAGLITTDTSLTVNAGAGALFPSLGVGDYCYCTLTDASLNREIIKVTARTGDSMTIVRAQQSTAARTWATNDAIELRPTSGGFEDFLAEATAALNAHLADAIAAHIASAIGVTPVGNIASTDVQAALAELDAEKTTAAAALADAQAVLLALAGGSMTGALNEAIATVASSATPNIWSAAGNVINYTGTATATGFAAAPQAGARRTLVCAGAAVFTAGANMLIDGVASASSFTASAGDKVHVIAVSTTQFRLSPVKYDGTPVVATVSGVTSVTGAAPITSTGGTAPAIGIPAASAGANGYMSATYASKLDGIAAGATVGVPTDVGMNGIGMMALMQSVLGVASGGTVPGTGLSAVTFIGGVYAAAADAIPGTWRCVGPGINSAGDASFFQRIS